MAVSIPDTLTINSSERYLLSIRISPDGFSFSGIIPDKRDSFFYRQISFDRSKDYASSLKDAFFEEECLAWSYKKVSICCFTPCYLFVPESFYDDDKKLLLMQYAFLTPQEVLSTPLIAGQNRIVYGIEQEVYEFLCRSFVNPEFIHHLSYPFKAWKQQNELAFSAHMYVLLHKKSIDIGCFKRGEPVFLNSFNYTSPDDVMYFITCVWKQMEMNQLKDRLLIFGDPGYKKELMLNLKNYIQYVSDMELPSDAYLRNPEIMQAPYDLILSVCE